MHSVTQKLKFIESIFGRGFLATNGKNFGVRCPFCAPSDANKRKLVIRVEDDVNHCWTCGRKAHTLAPLIRKFGTQAQLLQYRDEFMPENERSRLKFIDDAPEKKPIALPADFKLLVLTPLNDPDVLATWNFLRRRNVTQRDAWYFKLGVSNETRWKRRVIVPSFNADGILNYFVARNVDENDRRPKYDNPDDDKLPIVFNEINVDWSRRLVVCEGTFDAMKCGENTVPLLGSDLNEESRLFTQILLNNTPVALALDGDMWSTKTPKIAKCLQEYGIDVVVVDTRERGDPGNMSKSQFRAALDVAKEPTWNSTFSERLERATQTSLKLSRRNTYHVSHEYTRSPQAR